MRRYSDEELMAYADGALPDAESRQVAAAARTDPELARRIAAYSRSRRVLQEAFAGRFDEAVPQRLLAALSRAPAERNDRSVPPPTRRRPAWAWLPLALAAMVIAAVGLMMLWQAGGRGRDALPAVAGVPADAATLDLALERQASGVPTAGAIDGVRYEILPTATVQAEAGIYCREFESTVFQAAANQSARGLACRQASGHWQLRAVVAATDAVAARTPGGYEPAAASGVDLTAAALGPRRRLTPQAEQALIERGWEESRPR